MRRDYYIIEAKNLDNKSRVPVFIPPASASNKIHRESRSNATPLFASSPLGGTNGLQLQTELELV